MNMTYDRGCRPDADDADCLCAYCAGNAEALRHLVQRYRSLLYGYAYALCGNGAEADDIFQETWLRVIRHAARFRAGNFKGWLLRIAHNVAIDRIRKKRGEVAYDRLENQSEAFHLTDAGPSPAASCETADRHREILRQVGLLPLPQREVFLLRTLSALSFREIAKIQKVSINTALGRMHYAVNRLRETLTARGEKQ